ncbi:MAG: hydrogenase nickel incorporation protein HypB [Desulfurella sp.]|uniref:hydrogenase nickel incorporation protein HypB n=1 Tax=Desulfurella TaxID=33001 RepID=UPI0003E0ADAE|nr:hydrogenase nickel incorporation protein HypB [Desulfurella multipotens]AHF96522.1 hydantoin utilization protein A [Desulfurella acetivorans A63]PMP69484.1 MAG: hydrogenase accessory protein HypB [Desulfurella multipotens]
MKRIVVEKKILEKNDDIANSIRNLLDKNHIFSLNVMSSPGAGKTTLIERIVEALKPEYKIAAIDGDLDTQRDAQRIAALGIEAVQINTSGTCHLDSSMVQKALNDISLDLDLLIIENVGNLVCPASFYLGTHKNAVLISTPEGDDKVKKYPTMFNVADVVLINKMDIAQFVNFNVEKVENEIKELNPNAIIFKISAIKNEGLSEFINWIKKNIELLKHQ